MLAFYWGGGGLNPLKASACTNNPSPPLHAHIESSPPGGGCLLRFFSSTTAIIGTLMYPWTVTNKPSWIMVDRLWTLNRLPGEMFLEEVEVWILPRAWFDSLWFFLVFCRRYSARTWIRTTYEEVGICLNKMRDIDGWESEILSCHQADLERIDVSKAKALHLCIVGKPEIARMGDVRWIL